jgi:single-stranded DNA-binding protein
MDKHKNRVELIGESGPAFEFRVTAKGTPIVRWFIACEETHPFHLDGEIMVTEKQLHRLCATGKTAEFVRRHLEPGQRMAIEGRLLTRLLEDENSVLKENTEVWVQDILLLSEQDFSSYTLRPEIF